MIYKIKRFSVPSQRGVLEVSSSGVKLLLGPSQINLPFKAENFRFWKAKVKTKEGLQGGKMRKFWFIQNILPVINHFIEIAGNSHLIGVATAWARESSNIEEILDLIPIPIRVLSKQEEAKMALIGYMRSSKRDLSQYQNIISIDQGGLSTEVAIYGGKKVSVLNSDPRKTEARRILGDLHGKTLVTVAIRLYDTETGKPGRMSLHDKEFPIGEKDTILKEILDMLPEEPEVVINGTNLAFGVYYSQLRPEVMRMYSTSNPYSCYEE